MTIAASMSILGSRLIKYKTAERYNINRVLAFILSSILCDELGQKVKTLSDLNSSPGW
jgi:hypothetical protein